MGNFDSKKGSGYPGAVRVLGGAWRGRKIHVPIDRPLRPTPSRVRETLFAWLDQRIIGAYCLDLFAGIGALGLEALSRGASRVVFVERDRRQAAAIAADFERFDDGLNERDAQVLTCDAMDFLDTYSAKPFDIVFVDPPYAIALEPIMSKLRPHLAAGAIIYAERPGRVGLPEIPWLEWYKKTRAGDVAFGLARFADRSDDVR